MLDLIQEGNIGLMRAIEKSILEKDSNFNLCYLVDKTRNNKSNS